MSHKFGSKFSQAASEQAVHLLHAQQKNPEVKKINYKLIASKLEELEKTWRFTNQQVRDHLMNLDPNVTKLKGKAKGKEKAKRKREEKEASTLFLQKNSCPD